MCVSDNIFEKQAYLILKQMADSPIYKPVKLQLSGGETIDFLNWEREYNQPSMALIKKVIVEDQNGSQFSVDPDEAGLKFTNGEIGFEDYQKIKRTDTKKLFTIFSISIGSILGVGIALTNIL
ncbi:hypothetical protein V1502_11210 [Bacillus sp. SCS-153A]|uniref:hypothetical protein n=1 Tax=Rossellomorea sedimentorum TaxID=3115294 RepID=UPI003905CABE